MKARLADYVFVSLLATAGLLYLQLVHLPSLKELKAQGRLLATTRAEILKSEDFIRGLDDLERYLREFEQAIADLDRLVPQRLDADDRLREISSLVLDCGLRADSIRPDAPHARGAVTSHPLSIKVSGSYAAVSRFLAAAESLPRHSRVTELTLQHSLEQKGALGAEIELTSYSVGAAAEGGP